MAHSFEDKLCAILVAHKIITAQEAKALHKNFHDSSKETFDDFLLSESLIKKEDLLKALSEYYQIPSFDVVGHFFDHSLLLEFPQDVLINHGIIPLERDENMLFIVASQPDNEELLPELAEYVSDEIQFFVGLKPDILDAVIEYYQDSPFQIDEEHMDEDEEDELYEDEDALEDVYNNRDDDY